MTVNKELIAPCGINCAPCPLYLAQTNDDLARDMAKRMNAPVEKVSCVGCRPAEGMPMPIKRYGKVCPTYACAESKGIHTCAECADLPCEHLAPTHEMADKLPHNTKLFSLMVLKRDGYEAWEKYYPRLQKLYFTGKMIIGDGPKLEE